MVVETGLPNFHRVIVAILNNSSVIGKKAYLKTCVSRKQSTPIFPKNKHFLPPNTHKYVYMYQGVRNVCFSENLTFFVYLKHTF